MVHAEPVQTYDAIIIGGGPAGSTCARFLTRSGARVVILDRNRFPRVKLCAGWLSRPVWDVLEIAPDRYPRGLWPWERCHVHYGERRYTIAARGYFIRRYEFDDYLLRSSGADIVEGHSVRDMVRDGDRWVIDGRYAAPVLIGAGGTHCPVARTLFDGVGARAGRRPVGVQEHEFSCESAAVARHLSGRDGEPELLLHGDLRGYSWNIPKTDWINIGCGTINPREVRAAWTRARDYFEDQGQVPPQAQAALDHMKGHSYYLFHDEHLDHAARPDGAYLVGDALGLAQPLTAEGILPAILSGRLCAEAVAAGAPERYGPLLRDHPVLADYRVLRRLRDMPGEVSQKLSEAARALGWSAASSPSRPASRAPSGRSGAPRRLPGPVRQLAHRGLAYGFAWMFEGKPLPGARVLRRLVP